LQKSNLIKICWLYIILCVLFKCPGLPAFPLYAGLSNLSDETTLRPWKNCPNWGIIFEYATSFLGNLKVKGWERE